MVSGFSVPLAVVVAARGSSVRRLTSGFGASVFVFVAAAWAATCRSPVAEPERCRVFCAGTSGGGGCLGSDVPCCCVFLLFESAMTATFVSSS